MKKGELLSRWKDKDCRSEVTAIAQSKTDPDVFAVGHADGSIRLWDSRIETVIINFNGHRSAVTTLAFDSQGVRLASGSKDTDIIVWDLVAETGLFKLRGHKNQITGLHFLDSSAIASDGMDSNSINGADVPAETTQSTEGYLLSTSKDALIKIWDVASQYCLETHVTQSNGECWSLGVSADSSGCITAGNEGQLTVWTIDQAALRDISSSLSNGASRRVLAERGSFNRHSRDHTTGVSFHPKANFLALHGSEKAVEIWRIRTPSEIEKAMARKRKRRREKAAASGQHNQDADMVNGEDEKDDTASAPITEVFVPYVIVRTGGKVRSIEWASGRAKKSMQILITSTNNQVELYDVAVQEKPKKSKKEEDVEYNRTFAVDLPGHRTDVRAMALSSDDRMLATASSGSLKVWNVRTSSCLRTLDCGYALCCSFLPGDKIVLVGNKSGELELFDISSSSLIDTIPAHDGPIWSLKVHPHGQSVVTGSADKTAKFWSFSIIQEEIPGTKRTAAKLKLSETRRLKLNDDILSIAYTPDVRLIAISTLDNTVKVFFTDTLKLFLTLYGHKLPVLSMSISSDSKLLATSSADKNIRLWGLDFGDCHKALFAHDDSILSVAFPADPPTKEESHLLFSASKDGTLKQYDADAFDHIQTLRGHHGEIWAMALSRTGNFVVTASHDKSIRVWSQTDEPLFLEEEREKEIEELADERLANDFEKDARAAADADENGDVVPAGKQTAQTLTASEKITEALALCVEDTALVAEHEALIARNPKGAHAPPQRHPLLAMRNVSAPAHLLSVFAAIPNAALTDALLLLPFSILSDLFGFIEIWICREMNVLLACRVLFNLMRVHHAQIVASSALRGRLEALRGELRRVLSERKSVMGFNLVATRLLARRVQERGIGRMEDFDDVDRAGAGAVNGTGKKRAFVNVA